MISLDTFLTQIRSTRLAEFAEPLQAATQIALNDYTHGELQDWLCAIEALPDMGTVKAGIGGDAVTLSAQSPLSDANCAQFLQVLELLHPWRKGPFNLFGIDLDCEWRSHLKWDRIAKHIRPLQDRLILDVGCGNGYYCWRMLNQNPHLVLGIDPSQKFMMQFQLIKHYLPEQPVCFLPLKSEGLPTNMAVFDTVFSMGVLYHRKSPFDHLEELKACLAPDGELVLETLVIEAGHNEVLVPADRYARMRNVWFIPSPATLKSWVQRAGFKDVRIVDVNQTSTREQRSTQWMRFQSLADYLDPDNSNLTVEGYPAPRRAIVIARK